MAIDKKRMSKPIQKVRKLFKKMPKKPSPEEVHALRTNTRRLEASMTAFSMDGHTKPKRTLKQLAKVRKRAGKVRDMDVLTAYASNVHVDGEKDCSVQLLEHLGAKRRKYARHLHGAIAKNRTATRKQLKQLASNVVQRLEHHNARQATLEPTALALSLEAELAGTPHLDRRNLHAYRLKVKELRNVLRMARTTGDQQFSDILGEVKDRIGEWHDWQELLAIAGKTLDHGPGCKLLRELKQITERKFRDALAKTEKMRRQYLGIRQGKTRRRATEPAEPVWRATRRLAA
jgi:CHAD domain-containing protein